MDFSAILHKSLQKRKPPPPVVVEEPNYLEVHDTLLATDCDLTTESIVSTTDKLDKYLVDAFHKLKLHFDQQVTDKNEPSVKSGVLSHYLDRIKKEIVDYSSALLDEKLSSDRLSLKQKKKDLLEQLMVTRETAEQFRQSYDAQARYRETEHLQAVMDVNEEKFNLEVGALNEKLEQQYHATEVLGHKVGMLKSENEKLEFQLRTAQDSLRAFEGMHKSTSKRGGRNKSVSHTSHTPHRRRPSTSAGMGPLPVFPQIKPNGPNSDSETSDPGLSPLPSSTRQHSSPCKTCPLLRAEVSKLEGTIADLQESLAIASSTQLRSESNKESKESGRVSYKDSSRESSARGITSRESVESKSVVKPAIITFDAAGNLSSSAPVSSAPVSSRNISPTSTARLSKPTDSATEQPSVVSDDSVNVIKADEVLSSRVVASVIIDPARRSPKAASPKQVAPLSGSKKEWDRDGKKGKREEKDATVSKQQTEQKQQQQQQQQQPPQSVIADATAVILDPDATVAAAFAELASPTQYNDASTGQWFTAIAATDDPVGLLLSPGRAVVDNSVDPSFGLLEPPATSPERDLPRQPQAPTGDRGGDGGDDGFGNSTNGGSGPVQGLYAIAELSGEISADQSAEPTAAIHTQPELELAGRSASDTNVAVCVLRENDEVFGNDVDGGVNDPPSSADGAAYGSRPNEILLVQESWDLGNVDNDEQIDDVVVLDKFDGGSSRPRLVKSNSKDLLLASVEEAAAGVDDEEYEQDAEDEQGKETVLQHTDDFGDGDNLERQAELYTETPAMELNLHSTEFSEGDTSEAVKMRDALTNALEVQNELQTRLLSLEYQNSKLSKKLRFEEAQAERQEVLHKLQMRERGVLLQLLVEQVTELRTRVAKHDAVEQALNKIEIPVRGTRRTNKLEEDVKREMPLPYIKLDTSGSFLQSSMQRAENGAATRPHLKLSASTPNIFGPPGSMPARGSHHRQQSVPADGEDGAQDSLWVDKAALRPTTSSVLEGGYAGSTNIATMLRGKVAEATQMDYYLMGNLAASQKKIEVVDPKKPKSANNVLTGKAAAAAAQEYTVAVEGLNISTTVPFDRLEELKALRQQIGSLLVAQNLRKPIPKLMATTKALDAQRKGKEVQLKPLPPYPYLRKGQSTSSSKPQNPA